MQKLNYILFTITTLFLQNAFAQSNDKIAVLVGKDTIFESDIYIQLEFSRLNGSYIEPNKRCSLLDELIINGILFTKAQETIKLDESLIDVELENRIQTYIQQFGSQEKLEEYLREPLSEHRILIRQDITRELLIQAMEREILNNVTVNRREVKRFYKSLSIDSIPEVPMQVEFSHLVIKPTASDEGKTKSKASIMKIYEEAISGDKEFEELASSYSMGPSSYNGGLLGNFTRGVMIKEFEDVAFNLEVGEVSPPFETKYGFHIAKLNKRFGDTINASHIIIIPEKSSNDDSIAKAKLNQIKKQIISNSITFEDAAEKWSKDTVSKNCGGCFRNPHNDELIIPIHLISGDIAAVIENMEEGEISLPQEYVMNGYSTETVFHIVYLKRRIPAHTANLKDDYPNFEKATLLHKQNKVYTKWLAKAKKDVRIEIKDKNCASVLKRWN